MHLYNAFMPQITIFGNTNPVTKPQHIISYRKLSLKALEKPLHHIYAPFINQLCCPNLINEGQLDPQSNHHPFD